MSSPDAKNIRDPEPHRYGPPVLFFGALVLIQAADSHYIPKNFHDDPTNLPLRRVDSNFFTFSNLVSHASKASTGLDLPVRFYQKSPAKSLDGR